MPFTILQLPLEIRELIYSSLMDAKCAPPQRATDTSWRRIFPTKDLNYHYSCPFEDQHSCLNIGGGETAHTALRPLYSSLMASNRQVRDEMSSLIKRRQRDDDQSAKADLAIYEENVLALTWLSIPGPMDNITKLEVDWRVVYDVTAAERASLVDYRPHRSNRSRFLGGDGGPPLIWWDFLHMLEQFIAFGPPLQSGKRDRRRLCLDQLICNVIDTGTAPDTMPDWGHGPMMYPPWRVKDAEELFSDLCCYMRMLLFGYQETYGVILYSCVRRVTCKFREKTFDFESPCFSDK